ncbi:MAG: fibronectin type III domain-containing protein [Patescibacteria group bacterium]
MGKIASKRDLIVLGVLGTFVLGVFYLTPVASGGPNKQLAPKISNIAVTYITPYTAIITWDTDMPTTGMAHYGLKAGSMGAGAGGSPGPVTAHAATLGNLSPSMKYYFYVDASNPVTNGFSKSKPFSFTTLTSAPRDVTPPPPPTVTGSAASASQINLTWSASADISGIAEYRVFRNGRVVGIVNGITRSYVDTGLGDGGLQPSTTYSYTVNAADAAGNWSVQSSPVSITTLAGPPDIITPTTPAGLAVISTTASSASLSWSPATDNVAVRGYKVYRDGAQVATPGGTSHTDSGLTASTAYNYMVAAYDAAGNTSAQSAPITATTLVAPPATTTSPTATSTP